jgi:hypothetical protein
MRLQITLLALAASVLAHAEAVETETTGLTSCTSPSHYLRSSRLSPTLTRALQR